MAEKKSGQGNLEKVEVNDSSDSSLEDVVVFDEEGPGEVKVEEVSDSSLEDVVVFDEEGPGEVTVEEVSDSSLEDVVVFDEEGSFGDEPLKRIEETETNVPPFGSEPVSESSDKTGIEDVEPPFGTESPFDEAVNEAEDKESPPAESPQNEISSTSDLNKKVDEIENKVSTIKSDFKNIEETNKETNETINKLNSNVHELLSIYEFLTSEINPFIEKTTSQKESQNKVDAKSQEEIKEIPTEVVDDVNREEVKEVEKVDEAVPEKKEEPTIKIEKIDEEDSSPKQKKQEKTSTKKTVIKEEKPKKIIDQNQGIAKLEFSTEDLIIKPDFSKVLFNWANYLYSKLGGQGMLEALDYYENIGWINASIKQGMINYAKKAKTELDPKKTQDKIKLENHIVSLFFLSKLQGTTIRPDLFSSIIAELAEWEALE